jgi:hypothetical protein
MWAHYARDSKGICLAFDEDTLVESFPAAFIGDVSYSDQPAQVASSMIKYAFATGKRRHTVRLIAAVNRAVYFTKRSEWRYEGERRMVVDDEAVIDCNGSLFGRVRNETLRYIILGQNIEKSLGDFCNEHAVTTGIPLLSSCVGKRVYEPFFSQGDRCFRWNGSAFDQRAGRCRKCGDPNPVSPASLCKWCKIGEDVQENARARSMLSATLHYGIDHGIPMGFEGLEPRGNAVDRAVPGRNARNPDPLSQERDL